MDMAPISLFSLPVRGLHGLMSALIAIHEGCHMDPHGTSLNRECWVCVCVRWGGDCVGSCVCVGEGELGVSSCVCEEGWGC